MVAELLVLFALFYPVLCSPPDKLLLALAPVSYSPRLDIEQAVASPLPSLNISLTEGLTVSLCGTDLNCLDPRVCIHVTKNSVGRCPSREGVRCFCFPEDGPENCNVSSQCTPGEVCAFIKGTTLPRENATICISESIAEESDRVVELGSPGKSEDNAGESGCIHVDHLREWSGELVYQQNAMRTVLCDGFNSCATPGHIVEYQGSTMMMKTYCNQVECTSKIANVNSPKRSRFLRLPSNTANLHFTGHAARYTSRLEEGLLSLAFRMGI